MSFFRVTNPVASDFMIADLGIVVAASASEVILSDQFSVSDLYLSADLEAAIEGGDLTVEIDYGNGYEAIAAVDYTNKKALSAFLNVFKISDENDNEDLVNGSDASTLHNHDGSYYKKTEISAPTGAALVGADDSEYNGEINFSDVQEALDEIAPLISGIDLDKVYDADADGVMNVDNANKDLDLQSDNVNDIKITRKDGADKQDLIVADVSADEVTLSSTAVGGLDQVDVRVKTDLVVEGSLTITGTITDTTVDELNVTNSNIKLRDGATGVAATDAHIEIERGTSGDNAKLLWDESDERFKAGLDGDEGTIALLDKDETITGQFEFQGGASTDPNMVLTNKASAPSQELGTANQIPLAMINNTLAVYDKSNSRDKFISVYREFLPFVGRDNANNKNEYARFAGSFTSNQSSARLAKNMVLLGMSVQTNGSSTCTIKIRKNGSVTDLASLALTASDGEQDNTLNVDFDAGDKIEVFIDGSNVDRPTIMLEFAERF